MACALAPWLGLGLYLSAVGYAVGDPLAYLHIQQSYWGQHWIIPFRSLFLESRWLANDLLHGKLGDPGRVIGVLSSMTILALMAWGWRKINAGLLTYLLVGMLFIHSQAPSGRTARYELMLFPAFLLLVQSILTRPRIAPVVATIFVISQIILFLRFATWQWVA